MTVCEPALKPFEVTITARAQHAILLELVERFGTQKALAAELGVSPSTVRGWLNLKRFPSIKSPRYRGEKGRTRFREIGLRLAKLTGRRLDDIFPDFIRESGLLDAPKTVRLKQTIDTVAIENARDAVSLLPSPSVFAEQSEQKEQIARVLRSLMERERKCIELRYGLNGQKSQSLGEVGKALGLTKERVRQIESKAIKKLQRPRCKSELMSVMSDRVLEDETESFEEVTT